MVGGGPEENTAHDGRVHEVVYQVSVYGHSSSGSGGDLPSFNASLSASYRPKVAEGRGGIEVDPNPADTR
jgi:hypothetical protein